jgi:hypothetical protein
MNNGLLRKSGHQTLAGDSFAESITTMLSYLEQTIIEDGVKRQRHTFMFRLWDNTLHAAWTELGAVVLHTKGAGGEC